MTYSDCIRSQVSAEDWEIIEGLGVNLDSGVPLAVWGDFVNFEKRRKTEIPFLLEQMAEYEKPVVFDACLGLGATTIGLKLEGINSILSNEIDPEAAAIAKKEAEKHGVDILVMGFDWRKVGDFLSGCDAVLCLGNSLTYLFNREDQLSALRNFRQILKPGGKLIVDERNYAHHFLNGNFRFSGDYVFCGKDKVSAKPIHVSDSMVVMGYDHKVSGERVHLVLYPFKKGEMKELIEEAGFRDIQAFGDYKPRFDPKEPEFITYVARK